MLLTTLRNRFTDRSTVSLGRLAMRLLNMLSWSCWKPNVYRYYCTAWKSAQCSLSKAQIRSLDYAVSSRYRKIFNAKSNKNVRLSMHIYNCDDVAMPGMGTRCISSRPRRSRPETERRLRHWLHQLRRDVKISRLDRDETFVALETWSRR